MRSRGAAIKVALAAGILFPSTVQAASFINGSFEAPGGSRRALGDGDTSVTGWVSTGAGGQIYELGAVPGNFAGDGSYYVSFGTNGATGGMLSQTFDTIVGQAYNVNYLLRQENGIGNLQTLVAEIVGGPAVSNSALPPFAWGSGLTLAFIATNTSTTLRFRDETLPANGASANFGLDAVTVGAVGVAAVPEPATWAMMIVGFGAIGGTMRRRSTRSMSLA